MEDTKPRVIKLIVEHLGVDVEKITENANFGDDLGADSLDMVELVMDFEEEFHIEITDADAESVQTVPDAIALVDKLRAGQV